MIAAVSKAIGAGVGGGILGVGGAVALLPEGSPAWAYVVVIVVAIVVPAVTTWVAPKNAD